MNHEQKVNWILEQHISTNHFYDKGVSYTVHLISVLSIGRSFIDWIEPAYHQDIELALLGHDLIEDTRVTYNDVKKVLGVFVADIIYAVTNEKGKNRAERANDKYYQGIRENRYAVFIKLCDRIANVKYSFNSMYIKEHEHFMRSLGYNEQHPYKELFKVLDDTINNQLIKHNL